MDVDQRRVLTAGEVAAETGYDLSTVCRWCRAGALPVVRKLPGRTGAWLLEPRAKDLILARTPPAGVTKPAPGRGAQ
jgi:predicted DNA-binding transcriptional regulator AlpA